MADYFTNFSLILILPTKEAQTYALELADLARRIQWDEAKPDTFPKELSEHLEGWNFETVTDTQDQKPALWLNSTSGGIDAACAFLQHILQKFDPKGRVEFEWSHDCSKPRIDAFGGGAAIITAKKIKTMSTCEWLRLNAA